MLVRKALNDNVDYIIDKCKYVKRKYGLELDIAAGSLQHSIALYRIIDYTGNLPSVLCTTTGF